MGCQLLCPVHTRCSIDQPYLFTHPQSVWKWQLSVHCSPQTQIPKFAKLGKRPCQECSTAGQHHSRALYAACGAVDEALSFSHPRHSRAPHDVCNAVDEARSFLKLPTARYACCQVAQACNVLRAKAPTDMRV